MKERLTRNEYVISVSGPRDVEGQERLYQEVFRTNRTELAYEVLLAMTTVAVAAKGRSKKVGVVIRLERGEARVIVKEIKL